MNDTQVAKAGFEYFLQEEAEVSDPASARVQAAGSNNFSLHGHRLSSLYRNVKLSQCNLKFSYLPTSSCPKYSNNSFSTRKTA
jgi:hypothetical protein